jgi:hypothetical protein
MFIKIPYNLISYGMCFHLFMSHFCPIYYQTLIFSLSYNAILIYSKGEMYTNKTIDNMKKYPMIASIIENYKLRNTNNIEIIKDNKVVLSTKREAFLAEPLLELEVADFCIYSDYITPEKLNKIIYFWSPTNYQYVPCKYSFISVNIVIENDSTYKIQLDNFYIAGNKINSLVVCYLLQSQHGLTYTSDNVKYVMNIIDHDVNMVSLCESDELVLQEDTYTINKSVDEPVDELVNESVDELVNESVDELVDELVDESTNIVDESTGSDNSEGSDYITIRNVSTELPIYKEIL